MERRSTNGGGGPVPEGLPEDLSPGLYAHIPFCSVRCSYCDFHVAGFREAVARKYVTALLAEADRLAETGFRPRTVFIGGGTPSSLPAPDWARLLEGFADRFRTPDLVEWTVEANPGTVDAEKARIALDAGVDRISTGAQTFDPEGLRVLGRQHASEEVAAAHATLREAGFRRLSLDLIVGWPGQTVSSVDTDLRAVRAIDPEHVSLYHLSYEDGTRLERQHRAGTVVPLADDSVLAVARRALGGLASAGYTRYEVSNLSRPGGAALHNLSTWRRGTYRGIGSGAASFDGRTRWRNRPDVGAYIRAEGSPERVDSERVDGHRALEEELFLSLRLTEGLDLGRLESRSAGAWSAERSSALAELLAAELVEVEEGRLRATERGFEVLDAVIVRLWEDCRTIEGTDA